MSAGQAGALTAWLRWRESPAVGFEPTIPFCVWDLLGRTKRGGFAREGEDARVAHRAGSLAALARPERSNRRAAAREPIREDVIARVEKPGAFSFHKRMPDR